jgi:hypothetical protein
MPELRHVNEIRLLHVELGLAEHFLSALPAYMKDEQNKVFDWYGLHESELHVTWMFPKILAFTI